MEWKYYFDKEFHVLRAGRAQFFAKFTIFYVIYSKKIEFFSGFRIAYIQSMFSERAKHNNAQN